MGNKQDLDEEMPYEKFEKYGLSSLTNCDLLAILLRTGTGKMKVKQLAYYLLKGRNGTACIEENGALINLYNLTYEDLIKVPGIGKIKALQIISLLEFSKRISSERHLNRNKISSPDKVAEFFMERLRHNNKESFIVTLLDTRCNMLGYEVVSTGSLTASIVHPREVFKVAIQKSAHSIIAVHNHPSGDAAPSREDIEITKRLKQTGDIIGIPLLDHIIIGDRSYKSLKQESYL